ncbi:FAD-dependent oxidoreductase [Longispora sp. K20-0274]|uniref:FAD-dependent oxidoreductase n=1 Tax=Longispora sp. K20-0274 TaxID=3088255 RepID=UPI00399A5CE0
MSVRQPGVVVVGAGLAGAAASWRLAASGFRVRVFEKADLVGGHARSEWFRGVPYEPNGAHIFHTHDAEVWKVVSGLVEFVPYRHRVLVRIGERLLTWPLQVAELEALPEWDTIRLELGHRPTEPDPANFETYCRSLLGQTLYERCVRDYTRKQWGRDPDALAAATAFGRIELRKDGLPDYFRDPHQGWPRGGYGALAEALLADAEVHLGHPVTRANLSTVADPGEPVVITSALDDFYDGSDGELEWRGVRLEAQFMPGVLLEQQAMVVNEPSAGVPWTRTIETKWALPELHEQPGTIVMREFPGADAKHYPVLDQLGTNRAIQRRYEERLASEQRGPMYAAGRLATYRYINMDVAIRDGLSVADRIIREHGR